MEVYSHIQKEHYADQMAQFVLKKSENELTKNYSELEAKYEQKRLALLVAEAKLQFDQGSAKVRLAEMRKALATMQYKVRLILSTHKART